MRHWFTRSPVVTLLKYLSVFVTLVVAVQARQTDLQAQQAGRLADYAVRTISIVVPDAERFAQAWADVLGVDVPPIREYPGLVFPEGYDASAYPRIASFRMANVSISMHHPVGGRSYWKDLLDQHGPALYRMNFSVRGLADTVAYLQRKGGRLVVGTPTTGGVNVSLWPRYGFGVEMGEARRTAPPTSRSRPAGPSGTSFASSPVFKVAFVVSDIERAAREYADLFGLDAPPPVRVNRSIVFPSDFKGDRGAHLKVAVLPLPGGIDLELNEPQGGQSIWRTHLEKHGRSMFSIGVRVKNVSEQVAYLKGKGGSLVVGGPEAPYAYIDFVERLGAIIEVHRQ